MQRCAPLARRRPFLGGALALAFAPFLLLPADAPAQVPRRFPANALRGELVVTLPPEVLLNGQSARLAPGARIRGADNLIVVSGAIAGRKLLVHYTLDGLGNMHEVWVLTPAEAARQPWPASPAQAAAWRFDDAAQAWSKP